MSFHPFFEGFDELNDKELDDKIQDLANKYFQTAKNPEIQKQVLNMYHMCTEERQRRIYKQYYENGGNDDLDNLINVK